MNRLKRIQLTAVFALTIAAASQTAAAQEAGTLVISGTMSLDDSIGIVGNDLATVFANGNVHTWSLTLHGVAYSNDFNNSEWTDEFQYYYHEQRVTRVHATSFSFEFNGPDANVLNAAVSQQLVKGNLADGVILELRNWYSYTATLDGEYYESWYSNWGLGLQPIDEMAGVSFYASDSYLYPEFSSDSDGFPYVRSMRLTAEETTISDMRPGNFGELFSFDDIVEIGLPVPPPPPLPSLNVLDASISEGNKGTTRLSLVVTLSARSGNAVTVSYTTVDGTAVKKSDYTAASGTLTIPSGQTQGTISISIAADRKREPNESFTVTLSNPSGATIADGVATATILNDD